MAFISSGGLLAAHNPIQVPVEVRETHQPRGPRTLALYGAIALAAVVLTGLALLAGAGPDALKASSLGGDTIGGLDDWITGITSNLKWIAGALAAAGVIFIAILFLIGHSRAQDYALRFGIGCAILAGGTGIVA